MEPLTTFLLYSLRFVMILSAVLLWVVALSDIKIHARKGSFTTAQLAIMAVAVSVVAVGAVAALNTAVPSHRWIDTTPKRVASTPPPDQEECAAFSYTFTYSFGLRRPTSVSRDCMAGHTERFQPSHVPQQRTAATEG